MIVTHSHFRRYQEVFYRKLLSVPFKIQLEIITVSKDPTEDFSITNFVGNNNRYSTFHEFNALYEREIPPRTREKYGIPEEVNGVVYLSPLQLTPIFGTHLISMYKTKVHFAGRVQVIQKIEYLEPLYDSCIGIQLFIQDSLKGG